MAPCQRPGINGERNWKNLEAAAANDDARDARRSECPRLN
jgi:hypothetical protein